MRTDIGGLTFVFVLFGGRAVNAERFLFVDVRPADRDGDWEGRDVHHYEVGNLDCGVQLGEVDSEATCTCGDELGTSRRECGCRLVIRLRLCFRDREQ